MIDFSKIKGQKRAVGILTGILTSERVPHAMIFSGPDGVGKRTTAKLFASALACRDDKIVPCQKCDICRKIEGDTFPDVISVGIPEGRAKILIDQVRELGEILAYRPFSGDVRTIIIDPADEMTRSAAAAILKMLEEPPNGAHFILITSKASKIEPTIVSRCQKVRFSPLSADITSEIIGGGKDVEEASRLSRGSAALARAFLSGDLFAAREKLIGVLSVMNINDPANIESLLGEILKFKVEFFDIIDILRGWYRDLIVYRETKNEENIINHDLLGLFGGAWSDTRSESLISCADALEDIGDDFSLVSGLNQRIALTSLFIRLTELKYKI